MTNQFQLKLDLYRDWINTVKEVLRGSGYVLEAEQSDFEVALLYFKQTAESDEAAEQQRFANEQRVRGLQALIIENFETVVLPDIRSRTGYNGNQFAFSWVYNQGEHIIEQFSSYRIPL